MRLSEWSKRYLLIVLTVSVLCMLAARFPNETSGSCRGIPVAVKVQNHGERYLRGVYYGHYNGREFPDSIVGRFGADIRELAEIGLAYAPFEERGFAVSIPCSVRTEYFLGIPTKRTYTQSRFLLLGFNFVGGQQELRVVSVPDISHFVSDWPRSAVQERPTILVTAGLPNPNQLSALNGG